MVPKSVAGSSVVAFCRLMEAPAGWHLSVIDFQDEEWSVFQARERLPTKSREFSTHVWANKADPKTRVY